LIEQRIRILLEHATSGEALLGRNTIGACLSALLNYAPDRLVAVLDEHGPDAFLRLILTNGTLPELFRVLQYATRGFRIALLEQLTAEQAEALLNKTIAAGRSTGALHLREVGETDPELLARLEQAIGTTGFLSLILTNGTLLELFNVLRHATRGFRTALLERLTAEQAEALLDKTIAAGRSIGTLSLAMRELGETDPELLARLERAIGAAGFLRLILTNAPCLSFSGSSEMPRVDSGPPCWSNSPPSKPTRCSTKPSPRSLHWYAAPCNAANWARLIPNSWPA